MLLILNPGSRAGKGRRCWPLYMNALSEAGIDYETCETNRPGHAFELARDVNGIDTVIAVGGDGTINEVLDGVMQSANTELSMGVLYAGTSPDFCRFHGIPDKPHLAVQALIRGRVKEVDVIHVGYCDVHGNPIIGHIGCSSNIGLGASVARIANHIRRYVGDFVGTGSAVLTSVIKNHRVDLKITIDGSEFILPRTNNLSILKNPLIASGIKVNIDLLCDDGQMAVVGIHHKGVLGVCRMVPGFYTGNVINRPEIFKKFAQKVSIEADELCEIEFDGDPRGYLPASYKLLPKALRLIV